MHKYLIYTSIFFISTTLAEGGFYTGIGFGYANLSNTTQNGYSFNNGSSGTQNTGSLASSIYFGYNFNPYIGLQGEYNTAYAGQITNSYNVQQKLLGGSLLLHLPFGLFSKTLTNFDIYAKVGGAYSSTYFRNVNPICDNCVNPPGSANSFIPTYGLGINYGLPHGFATRLEWNAYGNTLASNLNNQQLSSSSDMYLLSILYNF